MWGGQGMDGETERRAEGQELEMGSEAFCTVGQLLVSLFAHLYIHPLILQQLCLIHRRKSASQGQDSRLSYSWLSPQHPGQHLALGGP